MRIQTTTRTAWLCLCFVCQLLYLARAQNTGTGTAGGQVRDSAGAAVHGALVAEKGVKGNTVLTNENGFFKITLKGTSQTLVISYTGFKKLETRVKPQPMQLVLATDYGNLNDVVVVGYESQSRRKITSAIASVKGEDIQNVPQMSVDQMLQGRAAGVAVLSNTGEPGKRANVVIRGSVNVNGGMDAQPLYIIDGVIYDLNGIGTAAGGSNPLSLINPNDIESIDILKDASAASIYGARAGNGVILVKTKKPKHRTPDVNIAGYYGINTTPNFAPVYTGAAERQLKINLLYGQAQWQTIANGNVPIQLTDSLNVAYNNNIDWRGLLLRPSGGNVNNQDVSMSQITSFGNYRLSLNHYDEQSLIKGYGVSRLSPAIDLSFTPLAKLNVSLSYRMSFERRRHAGGRNVSDISWIQYLPTSFSRLNPEQIAAFSGDAVNSVLDRDQSTSYIASVRVTDTLRPGLLFNSYFSMSDYSNRFDLYTPKVINNNANQASSTSVTNPNWNFENYITWSKSYARHHVSAVGGFSLASYKNYVTWSEAVGNSISGVMVVGGVPRGTYQGGSSYIAEKSMASYYGRISYDYDSRYMLTASMRRDASSIYSAANKWGSFPSVSAGWLISEESFFRRLLPIANLVKLRASYGVTGFDPGSWYAKYQELAQDAAYTGATNGNVIRDIYGVYYLGGSVLTYGGVPVLGLGNGATSLGTNVHWVKNPQLNLGGDVQLFGGRINAAVDFYIKDAKGQFFMGSGTQANPVTGYSYYGGNLVDIRNYGWEFMINTRNLPVKSAFQWNSMFNLSINNNYITALPNSNRDIRVGDTWLPNYLSVGRPVYSYQVMQVAGVYQRNEDVPVDPVTGKRLSWGTTELAAGDPIRIDQNGDYVIDSKDLVVVNKSAQPKFAGGMNHSFSWKGFTLDVFTSFIFGRNLRNGNLSDQINFVSAYNAMGVNSGIASYSNLLGLFWQKPGDQARFPKLVNDGNHYVDAWNANMSYFIEDGWFVKVKNVRLSYNLPQTLTRRLHLKNVGVYGFAENLKLWKNKNTLAADPELADFSTGNYYAPFPTSIKFTFGITMNL